MSGGSNNIVKKAEAFVRKFYEDKIDEEMRFHSFQHTQEVVETARELGKSFQLSKDQLKDLTLACWFHDLGFSEGVESHEKKSADIARKFLEEQEFPEKNIENILSCILVTENNKEPKTEIQKIIKDSDTSHVGKKDYFTKLPLLKTEWESTMDRTYGEKEWIELNLNFLTNHKFFSAVGQEAFNDRKRKNILKLQKRLTDLVQFEKDAIAEPGDDMEVFKKVPGKKPDRGIETMFRVTLRNHNQFSAIADSKSGIMLSINAIMLSIVISSLAPKLDSNPRLILPTVILIIVCMSSVVLATLATKPKITSAEYSDEKFLTRKFNMLFFGNFYKLPLSKFEWGIEKLMYNEELLYSSLAKDLYFLGLVLAKKYKYLSICYNVFVFGLILTAVSFILVLI